MSTIPSGRRPSTRCTWPIRSSTWSTTKRTPASTPREPIARVLRGCPPEILDRGSDHEEDREAPEQPHLGPPPGEGSVLRGSAHRDRWHHELQRWPARRVR